SFSIDTTSILIMAMFIVSGVLSPEEGFSGFNHPATLTLGCMFVVSAAVFKSGLIDELSIKIVKVARIHYKVALVVFCLISASLSAFINDSAVVAILIPLALTVCRETKIAPSMLLIPISFSALFGGTCTLIGTSTNILVSSYAAEYGLEGFGMFEFSLAALCLATIGFAYIFFVAPLLLPKAKKEQNALTKEAEKYITELLVEKDCPDIKKPLHKSKLVNDHNVQVLAILREGSLKQNIGPETFILEGDVMKVMVPPKTLNGIRDLKGYRIKGNKQLGDVDSEKHIYEVIVPFGSRLTEGSLRSLNFRRQYNGSVLAIRQRGEILYEKLADVKLMEGDMLLILGTEADVDTLVAQNLVVALSEHKQGKVNYKKAVPAIVIAVGVVLAASLNLPSLLISSMVGALLLVATSTLKPKEAYEAVEWKVIFMMAGVLSMGTALEKTGGAKKIAIFIQETLGNYDAHITLSILFLITFLSTNVLSSKAT